MLVKTRGASTVPIGLMSVARTMPKLPSEGLLTQDAPQLPNLSPKAGWLAGWRKKEGRKTFTKQHLNKAFVIVV